MCSNGSVLHRRNKKIVNDYQKKKNKRTYQRFAATMTFCCALTKSLACARIAVAVAMSQAALADPVPTTTVINTYTQGRTYTRTRTLTLAQGDPFSITGTNLNNVVEVDATSETFGTTTALAFTATSTVLVASTSGLPNTADTYTLSLVSRAGRRIALPERLRVTARG